MKIFRNIWAQNCTSLNTLKHITSHNLPKIYQNIITALTILLTMPVTIASKERSFSELKLIKETTLLYFRPSILTEIFHYRYFEHSFFIHNSLPPSYMTWYWTTQLQKQCLIPQQCLKLKKRTETSPRMSYSRWHARCDAVARDVAHAQTGLRTRAGRRSRSTMTRKIYLPHKM